MKERTNKVRQTDSSIAGAQTRQDFLRTGAAGIGAAVLFGPVVAARGATRGAALADGRVTITALVPAGPRFGTAYKAVAKLFEKSHPDIRVVIEEVPLNDLYTKEGAALGSNSAQYDAMALEPGFIPGVATKLTNIGALINADPAYKRDWETAVPKAVRTNPSYKGVIYGLPSDTNCQLMFYRADIFDKEGIKPPKTYADALEVAKALTGNTSKGKQYGFTANLARNPFAGLTFSAMMNSYGRGILDSNFVPQMETQEAVAALSMLVELMKYADPGAVNAGDNETVQAFATGVAVCAPVAWATTGYQSKKVSQYSEVTAAAPIPKGDGPKAKHAPWLGGLYYGIPAAAKHKKEAFEFGKFLTSARAMKTFVEGTGQPARPQALKNFASVRPYFSALGTSLPSAVTFPKLPEWFPLLEPLGTEIFNAVNGDKSVERALKDANAAWTKTLTKAGYYK